MLCELSSALVPKCPFLAVDAVFDLLGDVWFVVRVNSNFLFVYDIVHTELYIINNSLSSSVHIQHMKDILLCAEETSLKDLSAVCSPDLNCLPLWFTAFENDFVGGDDVNDVVV